MKNEIRSLTAEIRQKDDKEEKRVSGLGIVFDEFTEIFPGFRERISRDAVDFTDVVKSYFNHDPSMVLSTTRSNPPLVIRKTDEGLEYESPIPETSYGRDLAHNLEVGNVSGSSFTFMVAPGGDRVWEDEQGVMYRDITQLTVSEIGPVTDPAYIQTTAEAKARAFVEEARSTGRIEKPEAIVPIVPEQREEEQNKAPESRQRDVEIIQRHGRIMAELDRERKTV